MRSHRSHLRLAVVVFALAAGAAGVNRAGAGTDSGRLAETIEARIVAVEKTESLLDEKYNVRAAETRQRVRALYKLTRSGWARLWFDPRERRQAAWRRAAARRILRRDFRELGLLRGEIEAAAAAHDRLKAERRKATTIAPPARHSLVAPVDGRVLTRFGDYRHGTSRAQLTRRGIEMRSSTDQEVRAVAAGVVTYFGAVRNLGNAVVVAHEGYYSVIGNLDSLCVEMGDEVTRGEVIGKAAGRRIYVEVRLALGGGGQPIDPAPLFE